MRFLRIGPAGAERPVLRRDGRDFDLSGVTGDVDGEFLRRVTEGELDLSAAELPEIDVRDRRVGAPIARPGVIACIGLNYAAHAAESGVAPPAHPVLFYKAPNTLVGPNDDILVPRGSAKTDWEVELAVVIGRRARYLSSPDEALACVAGYAVANDVSERDFQLSVSGGQWSKGKSCETFNPMGPELVTPDELPDGPQALRLRSRVNGELRQDSSTADMVFDVATLIWHLSQYTVLDPGDVINTGTPEGVALSGRFPYLRPGDVVEMEIDGLGAQISKVAAA
ncbi:MAG: fumarylacetoacetate hydrolase family protein [Hamadaea sp.]|nr:fumarylacetoacetate hydrolase family protein [Hamadaea sp.]